MAKTKSAAANNQATQSTPSKPGTTKPAVTKTKGK